MNSVADKKTTYRLGWGAIIVLMFAAGLADLASLIPFVGSFVSPVYWILVAIFLYMKGFGLMNPGRLATQIVGLVAEMIPVVQAFPAFLIATAALIILTRVEDKTGIQAPLQGGAASGKPTLGGKPGGPMPLNQGGVRAPGGQQAAPLNSDGVRYPSSDTPTNTEPSLGETVDGEEAPETPTASKNYDFSRGNSSVRE